MQKRMIRTFLILALTVIPVLTISVNGTGAGTMMPGGQDGEPDWKKSVTQPPELGQVRWLRNFDEAKNEARKKDKPLLVLFQEVPG